MDEQKNNDDLVLGRIAKRSAVGALLGLLIGMAWHPPFKGIRTTSNDVQGLTYFSWFMVAGVGMIFGAFAGLVGKNQNTELNRNKQTTTDSLEDQSEGRGTL